MMTIRERLRAAGEWVGDRLLVAQMVVCLLWLWIARLITGEDWE